MKKTIVFSLFMIIGAAFLSAQTQALTSESGGFRQEGLASWYGEEFEGRETASGDIFDPKQYTAAHPDLPFGTILTVTNTDNNSRVQVRINDRGPFVSSRIIDVSKAAAERLGMLEKGTANVLIEIAPRSYRQDSSTDTAEASPGSAERPAVAAVDTKPQNDGQTYVPASRPAQTRQETPAQQEPPRKSGDTSRPSPPPVRAGTSPAYSPVAPPSVPGARPAAPTVIRQPAQAAAQTPQSQQNAGNSWRPAAGTQPPPVIAAQAVQAAQSAQAARAQTPPRMEAPPAQAPRPTAQAPRAQEVPPARAGGSPSFSSAPAMPPASGGGPFALPPQSQLTSNMPSAAQSVRSQSGPPPVASGGPPQAKILGGPIVPGRVYRIQVGSFKEASNALKTYNKLIEVGFNPQWERYEGFFRVLLTGVRTEDINLVATRLSAAGFSEAIARIESIDADASAQ